MSNIAVFLPRSLNVGEMIGAVAFITIGLGIMLYQGGEKIQQVVEEKSRVKDVPEATLVDLLFAIVLFVFKMASKIPMSTTWVFIGLLSGRELAISTRMGKDYKFKHVFPLVGKDMLKLLVGLGVSILIALLIQNVDAIREFF